MATKYYVVWQGRQTGIFTDWATCKRQVDGFQGARYKSFKTQAEAQQAFGGPAIKTTSQTVSKRSPVAKKKPAIKTYTQADLDTLQRDIFIFTDGGCEPNPGKAGSGVALYQGKQVTQLFYGLYNPMGTNNTAELNALHQALKLSQHIIAKGFDTTNNPITLCCDSQYSIQCITQWAAGWKKRGWKKASGEIKNLTLIQAIYALYLELKPHIDIIHVNGHVGVEGNELADRMSIHAIKSKQTGFVAYEHELNVATILAMTNG